MSFPSHLDFHCILLLDSAIECLHARAQAQEGCHLSVVELKLL